MGLWDAYAEAGASLLRQRATVCSPRTPWASDEGGSAVQSCSARILPAASLGGPVFRGPGATLDNRTVLEGNGRPRPQGVSFVSRATGRSSADSLGQPASPRAAVLSLPAPVAATGASAAASWAAGRCPQLWCFHALPFNKAQLVRS